MDSNPEDIGVRSKWQDGMAYMYEPIQDWPINKDYQGKAWESALPREELRAKYRNLPR